MGIAAGCSQVDEEAAQTPDGAPTIANSAVQTDAEGNTVETEAPSGDAGDDAGGDAGGGEAQIEAGLVVFQQACTACHLDDGNAGGGIGPQVAAQGLDPEAVRAQIGNGGAGMPAGLATGQDLDDVVAYVESLQ
ncbi:MAG: c-type cytochrome [Miltoncostaeaceae bacterium]